jgi:DNA-binding CsgD family transcriptional regulator
MKATFEELENKHAGLVFGIFAFCAIAFGIDVSVELAIEINEKETISTLEFFHFAVEIVSVSALIFAAIFALRFYLNIRTTTQTVFNTASAIKSGFDTVIHQKFDVWQLTKSEKEICLLAIRGLSITEIATHRASKEGTIKAHLHKIYVKAHVNSRAELMSVIMDEMLSDHSFTASGSIEKDAIDLSNRLSA